MLDDDKIKALLQGNRDWDDWVVPIQKHLPIYGIDTTNRIAMFFAQCGHESLNFKVLRENLNYSDSGLNKVFPKYFKRAGRDASLYHRDPERIANVVYANRMGNGDITSGDGWKYRGRGVIQLTGFSNYFRFAEHIKMTIDHTVAYLDTREGALESACWFWQSNGLNSSADEQDVRASTKKINGGYNGLEDREHHFKHALKVLGATDESLRSVVNAIRPVLLKEGSIGENVLKVQKKLGLEPDGIYGKVTARAVVKWQRRNALTADGIVGPKTYLKLLG